MTSVTFARTKFYSSPVKVNVPVGTYCLLDYDNDLALLQPLSDVHPFWAKSFWITETKNLIPRQEIYSKHLPILVGDQKLGRPCIHLEAPAPEAKLWRYMNLEKFQWMLEQGGIFLSRADKFDDRLEGTLSSANELYRKTIYENDPQMANSHARLTEELAKMKAWTYVSCWRVDENESLRCWEEYTRGVEGVAIQTTYQKLAKLTARIFCASVRYVDFKDTWIIENSSISPFMHKDKGQFDWEKEFRIILQQFPERDRSFDEIDFYDCDRINSCAGLVLEVNLPQFIERIVFSPKMSRKTQKQIKKLAASAGLVACCSKSSGC